MKRILLVTIALTLLAFCYKTYASAQHLHGKKVLYINSYHQGYEWSDGIQRAIEKVFSSTKADLQVFYMDTKNNPSDDYAKEAALKAKTKIESYNPDIVITSDDNAANYLIMPYYKNASLPFVFCGINWDASVYGLPYSNVIGIIEVAPVKQLVEQLQKYSHGNRIGFLAADVETSRKDNLVYKQLFRLPTISRFVTNYADWKTAFSELQDEADILIIDMAGIKDWDATDAKNFLYSNTKIPTGALIEYMPDYALISYVKSSSEQGTLAANMAISILSGKTPSSIAIAQNKEFKTIVNLKIAKVLNTKLDATLLKQAEIVQ